MIDFSDIAALRQSLIQLREKQEENKVGFWNNDIAIFNDVSRLSMPYDARRVTIAVFTFIEHGHAEFCIDNRQYEVDANTLVILTPGQSVQMLSMSMDFKGIFLCISLERHQQMMNSLQDIVPLFMYIRQHPTIELNSTDADWIMHFSQLMTIEFNLPNNIFRNQSIDSMLRTSYYKVSTLFGNLLASNPLRNSRQEDIFVLFIKELEKSFRIHREVSYYAKQLCVTPKYLSTVVKAVSGRSAGACIDSYVIEEAKMLMRTTRKSVQEVSDQLNFPNQSFFGKYFKRLTGLSPFQYRKANR